MKKTPMQELIENLEVFIGQGMSYSEWKKLKYGGKTSIQKYLEKEKEVMVDFAYKFGDEPLSEIPKWYDKQFKTKER